MHKIQMINKIVKTSAILVVCALAGWGFASCNNEAPALQKVANLNADALTVSGSLTIPDMMREVTRGQFGDTPKANLVLTLLEFDKGADASTSFLTNVYSTELKSTTGVANTGKVTFNVTLKASTTPKILHLMVADKAVTTQYGSEASLLPALKVGHTGSETEAYWGRVEFPDGYSTLDADGKPQLLDEVKDILKDVPVIRNFAKITVTESLPNFDLLGFELVNVPTSGTIAPWNQSNLSIPSLLDGSRMKNYSQISGSYSGIVPASVQFRNTEADARSWDNATNSSLRSSQARYMYEHPYESTRRTYLIINGSFNGQQGFYKIDIGNTGGDGMFRYYDIIRNINYNVVITEVLAAGTATVAEAIDRAPFNNLIAATETSSMLNVSDGNNMLIVNDTNHIIVNSNDTVDILYRYIENVTATPPNVANGKPITIGLEPGDVIKKVVSKTTYTDNVGAEWMKVSVLCNDPTADVKTQDFSIVDGLGLGKTIHLILRTPWHYAPVAAGSDATAVVRNTADDNFDGSATNSVISANAGEPLTVFFNLPDGLPESMFPLEFQVEAKYQGLENNKIGTMVVSTGPSLFDPNRIAISYIKTVSYSEYLYLYSDEYTNVLDINKSNSKHTIRCRFLTITAQANDDAEILIHNPYFSPNASVTFTRQ